MINEKRQILKNQKHLFNLHFTPTLCDTKVRSTTYFKCLLFQINKNLNHFLTPTLLPPCDTLNNTTQILIPGRAKEKSFRMTSYQDLGIFGVKIPLNVSTVSLPSPSHTFHGAASELDFTLHSRSSKNEIFSTQKVSHRTMGSFYSNSK